MSRPQFELADVIRQFGDDFIKENNPGYFHRKVLNNIALCRTAALGGHEDKCDSCGKTRNSYNSCGNRHCPKCQAAKQAFWIDDLMQSTLPVKHFHVIFTLPHILNKICILNSKWYYNHLFATVWDTLRTFGYTSYGVECGAVCVLHTWGQNLGLHPHLHCIVPAAGFSLQGTWKNIGDDGQFLHSVCQLSKTFCGKFMGGLKRHLYKNQILNRYNDILQQAWGKKWVVHCEPSLASAEHVVKYLGQYTHRVAITNQRILNIDTEGVTFISKDYRDNAIKKPAHLSNVEFLRRFCMHILPSRFVKIRRYGIYNNTVKRNLQLQFVPLQPAPVKQAAKDKPKPKETVQERFFRLTGFDICKCPFCGKGTMNIIRELPKIRSPEQSGIFSSAFNL